METKGGINTIQINGQHVHIIDLDEQTLCAEWAKRQREINELYSINAKANEGWRGMLLKLMGIHLPDKNVIKLGGMDSNGQSIYL